jgi:hypothetical protein
VNLLDFVFRLGVVFAIYGFLWGLIELGIMLLSSGRKRSIAEIYLIKAIKYVFLADVTFLFCLDGETSKMLPINQVVLAGVIILTYFIGKLQKNQNKSMLFKFGSAAMPQRQSNFNLRAEMAVIILALLIFSGLWFSPEIAINPISLWFKESIINIENTPVFGFIFKVIGFFFLLSILFKMVNAFTFLLNGGKSVNKDSGFEEPENEDHFDDFEELN